jgi:hypothetical protein
MVSQMCPHKTKIGIAYTTEQFGEKLNRFWKQQNLTFQAETRKGTSNGFVLSPFGSDFFIVYNKL